MKVESELGRELFAAVRRCRFVLEDADGHALLEFTQDAPAGFAPGDLIRLDVTCEALIA